MKNAKRLVSVLTVVCMIFSLFSTVTFAAQYNLTIDSIESDIAPGATGRQFTVIGTLDGAAADIPVNVALFKGTTDPVTQVVNVVRTDDAGKFKQTYTIPFDGDFEGDYLVVANSPNAVDPKAAKFTMTPAKTTATITSLSIKNDREILDATVNELDKTITISEVPSKVGLNPVEVTIVSDAVAVKIGDTDIPKDPETKKFIGSVSCEDGVPQTITLTPEVSVDPVAPYEFTIDFSEENDTAELSDVMVALYNQKTGNLRGFSAELSVDGEGNQTALVSLPGTFDLSKAYVSFATTAETVTYNGNPVIKIEDSVEPTELDFSNPEKRERLVLVAESGDEYYCDIIIKTNSAEFEWIELDVAGGPAEATINKSAKTITAMVPQSVGLNDLVVNFGSYDAPVTHNGRPFVSGDTLSFNEPQVLVLTDDKENEYAYEMTVTIDPSTIATLYEVKVAGKAATIDQTTKQVTVEVPATANLTRLLFAYTVAPGATVKIGDVVVTSGTEYNFLETPKTITVTPAKEGVPTYEYTITVTQAEGGPSEGDTITQTPDNNGKEDSFVVTEKPTPPVVVPPVATEIKFTDLGTAEWAREAITNLAKRGVISGRSATVFDPDGLVTREEYAKMLVLAFGLTADNASCDFNDVPEDAWYYDYVAIAAKRGVVNGIGNSTFGVGSTITRQDMAVMTYRAAMAAGKAMDMVNEAITFADDADIAEYAAEAVTVMQRAGIINGMGGNTFAPNGTATRAQAAKIMDMASK